MNEQKVNLCDGCSLWPCGTHAPIGVDGCIVTECANRKPTSGELIATLKAQRDELLAAAAEAVKAYDSHPSGIINPDDVLIWAQTTMTDAIGKLRVVTRAAIVNAEKDKP